MELKDTVVTRVIRYFLLLPPLRWGGEAVFSSCLLSFFVRSFFLLSPAGIIVAFKIYLA